jgi:FkbM family methyltransferase
MYQQLKPYLASFLRRFGTHNNLRAGFLFDLFERRYSIGNCSIDVPRDLTDRAFRSRFFFRVYETEEVDFVQDYVQPDDVVLEVGGCLGVVSCVTNQQLAEPAQHVVVEANPQLIPWLEHNRDRNDCHFQVEHALVADDHDGTFYLHDLVVGGSATRETERTVQVPVVSLGDLSSQMPEPFSVCILDIEGGEHELITRHPGFFENLRLVIVEFHDHLDIISADEADACRKILRNAGLQRREVKTQVEVWVR